MLQQESTKNDRPPNNREQRTANFLDKHNLQEEQQHKATPERTPRRTMKYKNNNNSTDDNKNKEQTTIVHPESAQTRNPK